MKNALEKHGQSMEASSDIDSSSASSSAKRKAFDHYTACVDKSKLIESLGDEPLRQILEEVGNWNVSGNFSLYASADGAASGSGVDDWDFVRQLDILHGRYLNSAFFGFFVEPDDKNSSWNILGVDEHGLSLSRSYYINDTIPSNAKGLLCDVWLWNHSSCGSYFFGLVPYCARS